MTVDVEVSEQIAAPAVTLYEMVSDLPRMGEWSPENTGGKWQGGATAPAVGAKFRGTNRSGWRLWATTVTVTAAEPGRRFAFDVDAVGVPVAAWSYTFAANGDGACTVTESFTDRRPGWMRTVSVPLMGVSDRNAHNRRNMEETLRRLKSAAEA